ncbi:MAG: DUF1007 family protein [Paracoccus sp. (in: a-proteobacteria)]|nr:DUF1007 family protein [Paracoccus sp. (in: a-proteobacteria)]
MKTRFSLALAGALAALAPAQAIAHPHIFIDASLVMVFDAGGRLSAIKVEWAYDEFYSLSMIAEHGLDPDRTGAPDPERLAGFAGKDVAWDEGFPGDLSVMQGAEGVALGPVRHYPPRYAEGRIITAHSRPLAQPLEITPDSPVTVRVYDPEYFVAYDTPENATIQGSALCEVTREAPDAAGAQMPVEDEAALLDALSQIDRDGDALGVMEMEDVGIVFADRFVITCSAE